MKASDVIELAKNDARYLNDEGWLCAVICHLVHDEIISEDVAELAKDVIRDRLDGKAFLRSKLIADDVISRAVRFSDPEYATVAHKFWEKLIVDLRAKGQ